MQMLQTVTHFLVSSANLSSAGRDVSISWDRAEKNSHIEENEISASKRMRSSRKLEQKQREILTDNYTLKTDWEWNKDNAFGICHVTVWYAETSLNPAKYARPQILIHIHNTIVSISACPISWGCRIHRLHLCREVRTPTTTKCPGYNTKQSDGEVPLTLELWGMQSTPSLPLLPGPLWLGMGAPDRVVK